MFMLEVIGAGFGRTGTHSLAAALESLSFGPCYHMHVLRRNPDHASSWLDAMQGKTIEWKAFFRSYKSVVEWPTVSFLPQILPLFPHAKVILTLREPGDWYESARATIFDALELSQFNPDATSRENDVLARRLILDRVFSGRYRDAQHAIEVYNQHIARVVEMVPSDRLLKFHISEGWGPLCRFLGVDRPGEAFPQLNERKEFMATEPKWAKEARKKRLAESDETVAARSRPNV
jgi:hypothetical protein